MIKTDDLNEYVLLSVIKNFCETMVDCKGCSECALSRICDCGMGSKAIKSLNVKYEPDDKEERIKVTYDLDPKKDAEEKQ